MTTAQFLTTLVTPMGCLLIGAWAYWIATREARKNAEDTRGK